MNVTRSYRVALACLCLLFAVPAGSQTLVNDLNGTLELAGIRSIPSQTGQIVFAPGDNSRVYIGTFGSGVIRYDYDPNGANGSTIFSNQQTAVASSITNVGGVNGSLGVAFHNDPTLGVVMYIAPAVPFGGGTTPYVQTIVRLTDNDGDGNWGEAGEVNQTIVDNIVVSGLHQINQMEVVGNTLYVAIGIRTQNGGQTAAQNQATGGSGVDQSNPGETAYTGTVSFIEDLTLLSGDTTTTNLAGFTINGISNGTLTNDNRVREDIQPFVSTDQSKLRIFATGFRNDYGLAVDDDGEIWVSYNENENPNAQDKLQRNVTYKSHHLFFKGNNRMGRWDTVGDEANGVLMVDNMAVLDAGWFDAANEVSPFALLGFNTAAGGITFYPSDFTNTALQGDALVARNSGSGSDVVHVDETTGAVSLVLEGLARALDVARDPFGNFIAGGGNNLGPGGQIVMLRVSGGTEPPPPGPAGALHLSLGEAAGSPDQETLNGDVWNNIVGSSLSDSSLQYADGSAATGIIATPEVGGATGGSNPSDGAGAGYVLGLDSATLSLIFSLNGIERASAKIDGLEVGSEWTVLVYAGLNETNNRSQDIRVNGTTQPANHFDGVHASGQPITFNNVVVGQDGRITVDAINGTSDVVFLQAVSLIPVIPPPDPSSFVGAHLAYGGSAFGAPESAFIFFPFSDGALVGGPNDFTSTPPQNLFGGPGAGADAGDEVLNVDSLPAGQYAFLFQENQPSATEYELEFITVQAPGSTVTPPTNSLSEVAGTDSISSDFANPTPLLLGLGSNTITGEIGAGGGTGTLFADGTDAGTDADYFTVTVPAGLILDDIVVNRYNQTQRGFMVYSPGAALSAPISQNDAIAPDKQPLLGGETAGFVNYSTYSRGINRVIIDIDNLPNDGDDLSVSDFIFRLGNDDTPDSFGVWPTAPAPSSMSVLPGFGDNGSDRIVIVWADNFIQNTWLQVSVKANNNTALPVDFTLGPSADLGAQFYFGHAPGEAGTPATTLARVNFFDVIFTWLMQGTGVPITSDYDFNRDGNVDISDVFVSWLNQADGLSALQLITPPGPVTRDNDWSNWADRYASLPVGR